ncbi:hypothetical protein FNJ47_42085 [Bradyrhizobium sp. UFLA 03-164]|uniref:Succinate dehydrogenase n=2 Tax=Bradyrhizobium uaiense TaxID=2594946 RepID=A0A6P1BUH9_9BRAD|nr:hypothetical protein [Bradyrhizobium uaiense]
MAAICHPFLLMLFHALVRAPGSKLPRTNITISAIVLICTLGLPLIGLLIACRPAIQPGLRRLAYAAVAAPTLYVFLGVVQGMFSSRLPDPVVWCILWLAATAFAFAKPRGEPTSMAGMRIARWRVAHGISAALLCAYILFHLANHLTGLLGPSTHSAVMDVGRKIYRAPVIEPVLILLFLFQAGSGLWLAWRWSNTVQDFYRSFQIASGFYLSVFVLGHMNSVFLYARTYLRIPTDWNFATGAPTGLIHDPWNIRLVPHYALAVFLVLSHLASGLRVVLIAHGVELTATNRLWAAGVVASGLIATAIIAGMCGVRI